MNPNLQTRIAAIRSECEEILRLSEKAAAGPWHSDGDLVGVHGSIIECTTGHTSETNASFISHARNVSPAMARVVMHTIEQLERLTMDDEEQWSFDALESIADQWDGKP